MHSFIGVKDIESLREYEHPHHNNIIHDKKSIMEGKNKDIQIYVGLLMMFPHQCLNMTKK